MKRWIFRCLLFSLVSCAVGCSSSEKEDEPGPTPPPGEEVELPDKDQATVKGLVLCDEVGISGVVVTDGVNFTKTDSQGRYWLRSSSAKSQFVYLSIPSGYEVPVKRGFLPVFYRQLKATSTDNVQRFDFTLKRVDNTNHVLMVTADMHIRGQVQAGIMDSVEFRRIFMPAVKKFVAALPAGTKVYGLNLGDMTQDTYWAKNNTSFPQYIAACRDIPYPMFQVIGNHDHDPSVRNISGDDDTSAELAYMAALGPVCYSFNLGKIHYIVLDNTKYINENGKMNYTVKVSDRHMEWLRKDISYIPAGVEHVVVAWHCPSFRRNSVASAANFMTNREEVYNLLSKYRVTILCGHAHIAETVAIRPAIKEYVHPALSGAGWYFPYCHDGAPSTFTCYAFTGSDMKRTTVDFNEYTSYRVYNENQTDKQGNKILRINLWDWHPDWTFSCRENGQSVPASQCKPASAYDDLYVRLHDQHSITATYLDKYWTDHFIEYTPVDPSAEIEITATDEFGQRFTIKTKIK